MKTERMLVRCLAKMILNNDKGYRDSLRSECEYLLDKLESEDVSAGTDDVKAIIAKTIHELGISAGIVGYKYVKEAITVTIEDPTMIKYVTGKLYPHIAEKFGTTPSRAERAIRHAVSMSMDRGDIDIINECFGNTIKSSTGRPTNREFIAMVAEHIRSNI